MLLSIFFFPCTAASTSENPSGNDLGHTERPTLPPDESGSNSIPVIVGAVCGCIAVVVICCAALGARVCRKKQRYADEIHRVLDVGEFNAKCLPGVLNKLNMECSSAYFPWD
uniref:Uncharacterized protein n=1 Tax=Sphaerodactylus townsendi TaxID=933632 RepID=A0ACB8F5Y6_9SAUR